MVIDNGFLPSDADVKQSIDYAIETVLNQMDGILSLKEDQDHDISARYFVLQANNWLIISK